MSRRRHSVNPGELRRLIGARVPNKFSLSQASLGKSCVRRGSANLLDANRCGLTLVANGVFPLQVAAASSNPRPKAPMKRLLLVPCLLVLILRAPSQAQILVDRSPPDHVSVVVSDSGGTPQYVANAFTLSSAATVGGFNFWGVFSAGGPTASFVVNFFTSAGAVPGTLLASTSATLTGAPTGGVTLGFFPEYFYQMNVSPLALGPGNYFVSVFDNSSGSRFAWNTSSQTGTFAASGSSGTGPWSTSPGTMAFQITGPAAVPEGGATGVFLCLALLACAALAPAWRREASRA